MARYLIPAIVLCFIVGAQVAAAEVKTPYGEAQTRAKNNCKPEGDRRTSAMAA